MIVFFFALVRTVLLTLTVRSFLSCLCCDIEDFTHLFLLLMIASMFSNSIHRPETCNNRYNCNMNMTKHHGWVVCPPVSYSGNLRFKSAQRLAILAKTFMVFFSPSRQMPGEYLKLGHERFFSLLFKLIIHQRFYHLMLHNLSYWNHYYVNQKYMK
jgi:hypothetical protein